MALCSRCFSGVAEKFVEPGVKHGDTCKVFLTICTEVPEHYSTFNPVSTERQRGKNVIAIQTERAKIIAELTAVILNHCNLALRSNTSITYKLLTPPT